MRDSLFKTRSTCCQKSRALHNPFDRQLCAFGGTHPTEANGPLKRANPELFEAVRPSFQDLVSKTMDGSKSTYKKVKRGYAKLSLQPIIPKNGAPSPHRLNLGNARVKKCMAYIVPERKVLFRQSPNIEIRAKHP